MATHSTHVRSLDHLVLTVADVRATVGFYVDLLGMEERTFSGRTALHLGDQKINLHEAGREFEPKALRPTPGSGDLCFVVDGPIEDVARAITEAGVTIEEGPVDRTGARGPMRSVYLRDPDQNLVELAAYPRA
ncbi:catechol 2,3-dioxygenase-like lactoylglutathione lyase family enzyme [Actinomycetospora succinea]|uniref:Catechol 2,3-dioxygenase-like lactoylglutathione lyase family enzyme n=1 Tax=Actinomycetospora succinea TaxID=663603 RepID=A0A4R6UUW8_9PSEU|nr:catechol 2,3-dioxygenase-like lactoylglutathione lyase family enzyme [Actinomycetospora succinea]